MSTKLEHLLLEGPSEFLDAVIDAIISHREGEFFAGIVEGAGSASGGVGFVPHPTDTVHLHLREGVSAADAKMIINAALDRLAADRNLTAYRNRARLMYEDETGEDREL